MVGIFGGSVAQWFALQGARPLIATLQASPGLRSRSILVLNFANGGYKQPQQLLFLNYLLAIGQRLDYVVNIDGFNEVAIAAVNVAGGISVAMPSVQHMAPLTNLTRLRMEPSDLARLTELSDTSRQLTELQAVTERHPLALMWVYRVARIQSLTRRKDELTDALGVEAGVSSLISLEPHLRREPPMLIGQLHCGLQHRY